jgi:hypothetical protein
MFFSMSSSSAFAASTAEEVILPNFELLPATMLKGLEDAAQSMSTSTDISGDFFNSNRAKKMPISTLRADDTILVPLFTTENAVPMDSSALAQGPMVYPQTRVIFATCLAYSQGVSNRAIAVGALVHFPLPDHVLIAKPNLVDLIETNSGTASDEPPTGEERASERFCTRAQAEGGETSYRTNENTSDKGMSKVMFDLDGGRYLVRDKSDLIAREKELGFAFRALDRDRWDQLAGKDYKLQASTYRVFILQQGRLREDHRHKAFASCVDQVQGLGVSQKSDEMKLLLMGHILVEGDEPSLTLADFVDPEEGIQISTCDSVCPLQNRPVIAVLKNRQVAMEVFLSSEFKNVFEAFIYALEGTSRPLERVFADFLKYQVEINSRKFFRVVSAESSLSTLEEAPLTNPEECACFLPLVDNLKDHHLRALEDEYFRIAITRDERIAARLAPTSSSKAKPEADAPAKKPQSLLRTCAGHFGKQLKAIFSDGRPYKCSFGPACKFRRVTREDARSGRRTRKLSRSSSSSQHRPRRT